MNLSTAIGSRSKYYSSVQGDEKAARFKLSRSMSPTTPTAAQSKMSQSPISKMKFSTMRDAARSLLPKKFLLSPCLPNAPIKGRRLSYDEYNDDDTTPVIFFQDEDAVIRKAKTDDESFVDPFAFDSKLVNDKIVEPKKKDTKAQEPVCSPASVFGLFTVEEESSILDNFSENEDEAVFFDDPFFPRSLTSVFDENTSIDISESIQSINAPSICDEFNTGEQDSDKDTGSPEQWFGFFNAESFTSCEWDPELEDESFTE